MISPHRLLILAVVLLLLCGNASHGLDFTGLESVPVQEGGRKKPFLVFADEAVMSLSRQKPLHER
jgi:hypothetical protein